MKPNANGYNVNKQPSLEEGSMRHQTTDEDYNSTGERKSNRCNRCLQLMKVILYIELVLFVGWIGCVFISNYYQDHNNNGLNKSYGTSKWSRNGQELDIPDSVIDPIVVSPDNVKWSPEQDVTKTITVKSLTKSQVSNKNIIPIVQSETTTAMNVIATDNTDTESMSLLHWLDSLAIPKNSWDESSSKSTSSESKFDWDSSSNEKSAFDANSDRASSDENHFETINKGDKIDVNFLLTLPLWHNIVFTSDYLDEIVRSDEELVQDDGITNGTFILVSPNSMEHRQSRKVRSTNGQDEDSSSSSSSEEDATKHNKPHHSNPDDSDEEDCPTILDKDGNEIVEPEDLVSYIGKNWFRWLAEVDIPECKEPKVAKTVTVDRCGKFVVNCEIEEETHTHDRHQRDIENAEKNNEKADHCKELVLGHQKDFETWRAKLVTGDSSDLRVQNIYQHIAENLFALTVHEIVERTNDKKQKTDSEWYTVMVAIRNKISDSIDTKDQNLLTDSNQLTMEMARNLGKIITRAVDIYEDCHNVLFSAPQVHLLTMLIERERCLRNTQKIITMKDRLAAEIVPGESTNLDVIMLRQIFKARLMLLIIRIAEDENQGDALVNTGPVNVTDEQWATFMLGLKQEIAEFPDDLNLQKQLKDSVYPTRKQTDWLREITVYYLRQHVQCSMLTLFGVIGQYNSMANHNKRAARSADSKWDTAYPGTLKIYSREKNSRRRRAVWTEKPKPTIVTCTLEDDDIQFDEERQERLERYNRLVASNTVDVREPIINAIERKLNGTNPTENSEGTPTPPYMRYMDALAIFMGNTSSSLHDQGYELLRDVVLELKYLADNETAFEGYDMDTLMRNWTGCLWHIPDNYTAETILMATIKAGEALNLHYSAVEEGKNCGDEFTPVYGTFTYVGEQPEKSFIRRWRHIFREVIRLYFRINNPEVLPKLPCTSSRGKSETTKRDVEKEMNRLRKRSIKHPMRRSVPEVTCSFEEDETEFGQERQERLDRYHQFVASNTVDVREPFVNAIEERLNGTSPTENPDKPPSYMPYLNAAHIFMGNTSLGLREESYKLLRDIVLELKYLADNEMALEGYNTDTLMTNWTGCLLHIPDNYTAETIFMATIKASEALNLHYSAAEEGKNCGDEITPVYGTFAYVGEQPEKSVVRRWRHIFEQIVRLYFKIHNPDALPKTNCASNGEKSQTKKRDVETETNRLRKRSVEHLMRRSVPGTTCISEEDATQFVQERQERLDRYNEFVASNTVDVREPIINAIEERLNGTNPTEKLDKPPQYMRAINAADIFMGSTSPDLRKENYKLLRDIILEIKYLADNETALEGYDMDTLMTNWGNTCRAHIPENYTAETILMAAIKAGEVLNIHYSTAEEGKNCGDEFTPVYGTFAYVGEQPEKSIVRRWRHILEQFVSLYFKIHNPEALSKLHCAGNEEKSQMNKREVETDMTRLRKRSIGHLIRRSVPEVTCTSQEDETQFGQERQERLDRYHQFVASGNVDVREPFLNNIEQRLNGTSPTENPDKPPSYMPYLNTAHIFMGNTSLGLREESYKLLRDIVLELKYLDDNEQASEGYNVTVVMNDWIIGCLTEIPDNYTAETILMAIMKVSVLIDLRYSAMEEGKNCGDQFTPVYGTFAYVGEQPEKSFVRRWRHIFGQIAHLYFKIHNPDALPETNCAGNGEKSQTTKRNVQTETNRLRKRSVEHLMRRSVPEVICTSQEDETEFGQERQERLDRYNEFVASNTVDVREPFVNDIEERLNGTSPTENPDKPPSYMRYLNVAHIFMGNTSLGLREESYKLLRDIVLELKYLERNDEQADEGYNLTVVMNDWMMGCLSEVPDNYTAETVLMAIMKVSVSIDLRYSAMEEGKNCGDQFTPVYGTFAYIGEQPEKSIVRRWRHIFGQIFNLYFKIYNPEALPKLPCANNIENSQTKKTHSESVISRLGKRSIGYLFRKTDNTVIIDEKHSGNDENARFIKANPDVAEPRNFDQSQSSFFAKMEALSSHIDRLHEMYQKYNELNDDYMSNEFLDNVPSKYES
ncbi:uncharacterized protein [Venturia canescens]|uniref:uncharacterized protein isoform X3 n=1 Tax=Venturia canescens TaxID=32260 RepID=UPI001C9CCEEF|nr:uncharacterized protein LOC122405984 isoform X3 [Venturia canescens]